AVSTRHRTCVPTAPAMTTGPPMEPRAGVLRICCPTLGEQKRLQDAILSCEALAGRLASNRRATPTQQPRLSLKHAGNADTRYPTTTMVPRPKASAGLTKIPL